MVFTDKSLEFQACMKLFEKKNPKHKEKLTETIDLVYPVDSPNRDTAEVLLTERKDGKEDKATDKEETTYEEHEKQVEDDNNNDDDLTN